MECQYCHAIESEHKWNCPEARRDVQFVRPEPSITYDDCPACEYACQTMWFYCPMCGLRLKEEL